MGAGRGASTHGRSATRSNSWARCSPSVGASASMPSVRADAYGLPATTASSDALETYDRAVDALLGWDAEALDRFGAAATTDPGLALAHAGLAICLFLDERFVEARGSAERARTAASTQTLRERGHVEAIALLVEGKVHDAEAAMTRHLGDFPRDLVVFQRLYFVWFWQGKFGEMLDLSSVLTRYYPGSSFMLGLHAFALEQTGRCDEALRIAQAAIGKNPRDAWSVHALAHALYELGAFDTGVTRLPPAIHPCAHLGWFRNHLLWHLILMHLGRGEYERASGLGRTVFEREPSSIPGDLHDSISLLWRLELCGLPVKDRWRPFAAIAAGRLDRQPLLFHAAHLAMALAAGGDWATAERQLGMLRERAARDRPGLTGQVLVPLVEGLHAFAAGDYRRTVERIEPLRGRIVELGGSRAQRDVFHDTLYEACFRAGDPDRARRYLAERVARRPDPYWRTRAGGAARPPPRRYLAERVARRPDHYWRTRGVCRAPAGARSSWSSRRPSSPPARPSAPATLASSGSRCSRSTTSTSSDPWTAGTGGEWRGSPRSSARRGGRTRTPCSSSRATRSRHPSRPGSLPARRWSPR